MQLLRDESAAFVLPPSKPLLSLDRTLGAVDAEEQRTGPVEFGQENGDEGDAIGLERWVCEDGGGDDANRVGSIRIDAGFIDPLGDERF